jgi:hypothetical protein
LEKAVSNYQTGGIGKEKKEKIPIVVLVVGK